MKVSWQITGIRQDAYAISNPIQVEELKIEKQQGKYLHPQAFGLPESMGVDYDEEHEKMKSHREQREAELEKRRIEERQRFEEERMRMEEQRQAEQEKRRVKAGDFK